MGCRDADLMKSAATGDGGAFDELMGRHVPRIISFARAVVGDDSDAEDVAQETFIEAGRGPFAVETPLAVAEVVGTRFRLSVTEARTELVVLEGAVDFHNAHGRVMVVAMERTEVVANEPPEEPSKAPSAQSDVDAEASTQVAQADPDDGIPAPKADEPPETESQEDTEVPAEETEADPQPPTERPDDADPAVRAQDEAKLTIHEAAKQGDLAAVEQHLRDGANANAKDDSGRTPLLMAAREGHAAVVELLLARGATWTIHAAAAFGDVEKVREFLHGGTRTRT